MLAGRTSLSRLRVLLVGTVVGASMLLWGSPNAYAGGCELVRPITEGDYIEAVGCATMDARCAVTALGLCRWPPL